MSNDASSSVEQGARGLHAWYSNEPWESESDDLQDLYRGDACAVLAAVTDPKTITTITNLESERSMFTDPHHAYQPRNFESPTYEYSNSSPKIQPLWTVEDLAAHLGVPVQTIYKWRVTGRGPRASKVGRFIRFSPEDVAAWLEEQKEPTV